MRTLVKLRKNYLKKSKIILIWVFVYLIVASLIFT